MNKTHLQDTTESPTIQEPNFFEQIHFANTLQYRPQTEGQQKMIGYLVGQVTPAQLTKARREAGVGFIPLGRLSSAQSARLIGALKAEAER